MDSLLRRLSRHAFRQAASGEHWAWGVMALAAYVLRRARNDEPVTKTVKLAKGERLVISVTGPEGHKESVEVS